MKKNVIKSTLAVAILGVAGIGGMKVYENHNTFNGNDLLSLNIEALSQNEGWEVYGQYDIPDIGDVVCDDSQISYCNRSGISGYSDHVYYDEEKEKWFKEETYYVYSITTRLYYCVYISILEQYYFAEHQIPYSSCDGKKTSCGNDEVQLSYPKETFGYWVNETHECPSPYM